MSVYHSKPPIMTNIYYRLSKMIKFNIWSYGEPHSKKKSSDLRDENR